MSNKDKAMLASYGRSFLGAVTTAFLLMGADLFALDMDSLRILVAAGLGATLPTGIRALNPKDPSFGRIADAVQYLLDAESSKAKKKAPAKKIAKK
jgi:hypothetical protein